MEAFIQPLALTCIVSATSLSGVVLGNYLSSSWQRKQWKLDNEKDEWRELLKTLTASFATICQLWRPMQPLEGDDLRAFTDAQAVAQATIRNRIFIAGHVKKLGIYETWVTAEKQFYQDFIYISFAEQFALISARIVEAATKKF